MPDGDGKITDDEMLHIERWVEKHTSGEHLCSLCHTDDWAIADHLVNLPRYTPNVIMAGGPSYPQVQLICRTCGQTELLNAAFIRLLPSIKIVAGASPEKPTSEAAAQ